MTKRRKESRKAERRRAERRAAAKAPARPPPRERAGSSPPHRRRHVLIGSAVSVVIVAVGVLAWQLAAIRKPSTPPPAAVPSHASATYVGAAACAQCHARGDARCGAESQHAAAMQPAADATVARRLRRARVSRTPASRRPSSGATASSWRAPTAPTASSADYEVTYTFGLSPLQQYLVALSGRSLQALGHRLGQPADGGRRPALVPPLSRTRRSRPAIRCTGPADPDLELHVRRLPFDQPAQGLRRAPRTYRTTWSEIDVSCEACHGPGSQPRRPGRRAPMAAPARQAGSRSPRRSPAACSWALDSTTRQPPMRVTPRAVDREVETCARCHARRGQIARRRTSRPSVRSIRIPARAARRRPLSRRRTDHATRSTSTARSSRAACSQRASPAPTATIRTACELRADGNARLRASATLPAKYDADAHTIITAGLGGRRSAPTCHMPTTTYMVVDPRHDHRFRIPRPDLTRRARRAQRLQQVPREARSRNGPRPRSRAGSRSRTPASRPSPKACTPASAARPARRGALIRIARIAASRRSPARARCSGSAGT